MGRYAFPCVLPPSLDLALKNTRRSLETYFVPQLILLVVVSGFKKAEGNPRREKPQLVWGSVPCFLVDSG